MLDRAVESHDDPEGLFFFAAAYVRIGATGKGLDLIERTVRGGYAAFGLLDRCFAFDQVRNTEQFKGILDHARASMARAEAAFHDGGGAELLGMNVNS
jgi:hypothetical protein